MKLELKILIFGNLFAVLFATYQLLDLFSLLHDSPRINPLSEADIAPIPSGAAPDPPFVIPKIIHQTYKTEQIPDKWINEQQSCIDLHPDYKYILWTDESARNFVKDNYNWFLPTFDSYPHNIMRADVIRYFVLYHYGGVYIDLDDGCDTRLDPLLRIPAWLRKTEPTGISNDIMASAPKHKFFEKVIMNLEKYNRNWLLSYITIMYSTGPLFLSVMWKQYLRNTPQVGLDIIKVMMPLPEASHATNFFHQVEGSSWHLGDAQFIISMGQHLALSIIVCTCLGFFVLFCEYLLIKFVLSFFTKKTLLPQKPRRKRAKRLLRHLYATLSRNPASSSRKDRVYTSVSAAPASDYLSSRSPPQAADDYFDEESAFSPGELDAEYDDDFLDEKSAAIQLSNIQLRAIPTIASRGDTATSGSALVSAVSAVPVIGGLFSRLFDTPRGTRYNTHSYASSGSSSGASSPAEYDSSDDEARSSKRGQEAAILLSKVGTASGSNSGAALRVPITSNKPAAQQHATLPSIYINNSATDDALDRSDVEYDADYDDGGFLSPNKQLVNISTVSLASSAANDDCDAQQQQYTAPPPPQQSSLLSPISMYPLRPVTSGSSVGSSSLYSRDEAAASPTPKTKES